MGPELPKLAGPAADDHADDRDTGHRVTEHGGADDGGMDGAVRQGGCDNGEPVIGGGLTYSQLSAKAIAQPNNAKLGPKSS